MANNNLPRESDGVLRGHIADGRGHNTNFTCCTDTPLEAMNLAEDALIHQAELEEAASEALGNLTDLQKALTARAINSEVNLLERLYGQNPGGGTVIFNEGDPWQAQIDALRRVESLLYPPIAEEMDSTPLKEFANLTGRLVDFTVYLITMGYLAPGVFPTGNPDASFDTALIIEMVDSYVSDAIDAEA